MRAAWPPTPTTAKVPPADPVAGNTPNAADWARTPERSNAFAMRAMAAIALRCGRRIARMLLHPIALYFLLFAPAPRRHSKRYLGRALGRPARWRDLYRHFHAFAAVTLDRVYLLRGRADLFDIAIHDSAIADEVLADGRGAFLVGAHVGSFEVMRVAGTARANLRIAMVMYPDNARLINDALRAVAPDFEPRIIALGRMGSMLAVREWLDDGGLAGMLGDRVLPGESTRAGHVPVVFLGSAAHFGDGPFRLAALLRRRVVFMVGLYLGANRYEVRFLDLADFSDPAIGPAEREGLIELAVKTYASTLESVCRDHPTNWFNFHDFWCEERIPGSG